MKLLENRVGGVMLAITLCLVAASTTARAASFDCSAAKSKAEHLICADPRVSNLDTRLDALYHAALETAQDQPGLARAQRAWMVQRNNCADAACLMASYNARVAALANVPAAGWRTYHDATLGISFDYLTNRQIKPCPAGHGPFCVALAGWKMPLSGYLIAFDVKKEPLEKAADDSAIFARTNGKWIADAGPGGPVETKSISGHGWTGITATIICNIEEALGTHAAGDCLWAVISNGKRSVVADTQGLVGTDENTARSLSSLRFDP